VFSATPITTQDYSSAIEVTEHLTAHETDSVRTSTFVSRNLNYLSAHMLAAHRCSLRSLRGSSVDDLISFSRRLELVRIERPSMIAPYMAGRWRAIPKPYARRSKRIIERRISLEG